MKVVLDTNVLVSALLTPLGAPAQVLQLILGGKVVLCHDPRILHEYQEVLARPKFPFRKRNVVELLEYLEAVGEPVVAEPLNPELPDLGDQPFLEVAKTASADYLVTGNMRHFPASLRVGVTVVSPAELLQELGKP